MLTIDDVQALLNVGRTKVYSLMRDGLLTPLGKENPTYKKRRKLQFPRSQVEALLRQQ